MTAGDEDAPPGFTYRAVGGMEAIIIGSTRWIKLPGDLGWEEQEGATVVLPSEWDEEYSGATGFTILGEETIDGERCQLLAFVVPELTEPRRQTVAWYLWWVGDRDGLRAQGGDGLPPPLHAQCVRRLRRADHARAAGRGRDPGRDRNARLLSAPASTSAAAPTRGIPEASPLLLKAAPAIFLLFWSGGFAAGKVGLAYTGPLTFLAVRYALVLLILLPLVLIMRPPLPRTPAAWGHLAVVGFLIQGLYFALGYLALAMDISSGAVALIVSLQPILVALAAPRISGERVGGWAWIGLGLGLAGAALVILARSAVEALPVLGVLAAVGALGGMTIGTLYEKRFGISPAPGHREHRPVRRRSGRDAAAGIPARGPRGRVVAAAGAVAPLPDRLQLADRADAAADDDSSRRGEPGLGALLPGAPDGRADRLAGARRADATAGLGRARPGRRRRRPRHPRQQPA